MPIIYNHQTDELVTPPAPLRVDDDGAGWWAGTQRCFASVALATIVAATSLTTVLAENIQQHTEEIVPPAAPLRVADDYWPNQVSRNQPQPLPAALYQRLPYLPDPDDIPAGSLFGVPDDGAWTNAIIPARASLLSQWPQPFTFDQQEVVATSAAFAADEDFWTNPALFLARVAQTSFSMASLAFWFDAGEVASSATPPFVPDEDFWAVTLMFVPSVASVTTPACVQPFVVDVQDLASSPSQVDEDYWAPLRTVGRVQPAIYQCLPLAQDQAESVFIQPAIFDEDFWPLFSATPQSFTMNALAVNWSLGLGNAHATTGPPPDVIPGPYWIRRRGHVHGLFSRRHFR